jgi:hypothetical protein
LLPAWLRHLADDMLSRLIRTGACGANLVKQSGLQVLQRLRPVVDGVLAHFQHLLPRIVTLFPHLLNLLLHFRGKLHLLLNNALDTKV